MLLPFIVIDFFASILSEKVHFNLFLVFDFPGMYQLNFLIEESNNVHVNM